MRVRFLLRLTLLRFPTVLAASAAFMDLGAQGVTTAAIEGQVRGERHEDVDGALVRVVNRATGYGVESAVRDGRYALLGLEVGGPYVVVVRRVGYRPAEHHDVFLTLGQRLQLDVVLVPIGRLLDTVRVIAAPDPAFSRSRTGVGTTISDAALRRLPTRNRDLYEFVQLTPEVSSRLGISGGGVNPRLNSYLVDGVSDRALQGNGAAGGASGGKAISIEAVKEYQVLLSPYDARHGDFAGALVNAVTKSGTNRVSATAFVNASNEGLARETPFLRSAPYDRAQFGFTLGGPVVRNRAHFFVATEFQRLTVPAKGPYVGQPTASEIKVPVADSIVARFADVLRTHGLEPGSAGPIEVGNPLVNLFGRIDVALPEWRSRFVLRHNYGRVRDIRFSRDTSAVFPLSSYGLTQTLTKQALAALVYTNLRGGALNELVAGYSSTPSVWTPNARSPVILVTTPHATRPGPAFLRAGTHESAQGISLRQETAEIADNLTIPLGADHQLALGARVELFRMQRAGVLGSYGSWRFSSLDSLRRGEAERFVLTKDLGSADAPFRGAQLSIYAADERQLTADLFLTFGLRADLLTLTDQPPDNALVESLFRRRTSAVPSMLLRWSPRIGFNWDVRGDRRAQLRGGAGIFVGRPPLGWLHSAVYNYGSGIGTLTCGSLPTDLGRPPPFEPDYRNQPEACANGRGFDTDPGGPVNLVNRKLQMAETFRASLAYDRMLPGNVVATVEGLYTRGLADFVFVNLNLAGPQATDRHGRVLYGTIDAAGRATQARVSNEFSEVIDLRNQSKNHSLQLSARLKKRFSDRLEASTSYAYSRVRDVQTPLSGFQANMNWQNGRVVSARHEDVAASTSALDLPHRVVVAGTYTAPWRRWVTDVSLYYVGESGSRFTYLASVGPGRGDLNADGTNANDPIYVPMSASDPAEIIFDPPAVEVQQAAFERLIASTECLRRQRGRIMARNSCQSPWVHVTNASIRQSLPDVRGHTLAVQLDVFNVLNLLHRNWGRLDMPSVALLEQVAQTAGAPSLAQPVFRYDPARPRFDSRNIESSYQLQLGLRYSF